LSSEPGPRLAGSFSGLGTDFWLFQVASRKAVSPGRSEVAYSSCQVRRSSDAIFAYSALSVALEEVPWYAPPVCSDSLRSGAGLNFGLSIATT
jgi:hypothetical protein